MDYNNLTKEQLDAEKTRHDLQWDWVTRLTPIVAVALSLLTYGYTWNHDRKTTEDTRATMERETQRAADTAIRESKKPYLERQLALYTQIERSASRIAIYNPRSSLVNVTASQQSQIFRTEVLHMRELSAEALLVSDINVKRAIETFIVAADFVDDPSNKADEETMIWQHLALSRELTRGIQASWGITPQSMWSANNLADISINSDFKDGKVARRETDITATDYFAVEREAKRLCSSRTVSWADFTTSDQDDNPRSYDQTSKRYGDTEAGAYQCQTAAFRDVYQK